MLDLVIFRKQDDQFTLYELYHSFSQPEEGTEGTDSHLKLAIEILNELSDEFFSRMAVLTNVIEEVGGHDKQWPRLSDINDHWPCSGLWLFIRVAIKSSIGRSPLGHSAYKAFISFFMCNLADHAVNTGISNILLHSMAAKILRRFGKFGSSVPGTVLHTCTSLSKTLDESWQMSQETRRSLARSRQASFPDIHEYISISLANHDHDPPHTPVFLPNNRSQ
ncbi:hypothetical protein L210DRAFT_3643229 [Boletus edulis BED1]|uniref:Uncharacterized protein n=1 Tax=Boletus edulis BED1 TaxID=1328754 RepID=A0AAD4C125_BOLED|nr:hypothetical protein L210DRAFT_3643229 [Boletus edulis BED1]